MSIPEEIIGRIVPLSTRIKVHDVPLPYYFIKTNGLQLIYESYRYKEHA